MRLLMWRRADAALLSASAVFVAATIIALSTELGPQARHMSWHILAMNVVAPLLAGIVAAHRPVRDAQVFGLWSAAVIQIAVLWIAHVPSVQMLAMTSSAAQSATHAALLAVASWFWLQLLRLPDARRWHGLLALLVTGKLVCLLAALLVFAPRALYGTGHGHATPLSSLEDQHLAGLLMIAACPLSYLVAGVVIAVRLIYRDHDGDGVWVLPAPTAG